jgi:hypothetical protein
MLSRRISVQESTVPLELNGSYSTSSQFKRIDPGSI